MSDHIIDGRWVTIQGRRVFIKTKQSPMDAYIRQKGGTNELIVYHSSPADFNEFDEEYIKPNDPDFAVNGFYFTEKEEGASPYFNSDYVYEVKINPNKLATSDDLSKVLKEINEKYDVYDDAQIPSRSRSWEDEVRLTLVDKGFDGMQTRGVNLEEAQKALEKSNVYEYRTPYGGKRKLEKIDDMFEYYEPNRYGEYEDIGAYKTLEEWKNDNPSEYVMFKKDKIKIINKRVKNWR